MESIAENTLAPTLPAVCHLRNVPTSPRKMRLVADLVRGKSISYAVSLLKFQRQHAARDLEKALLSAIANWQVKNPDAKIEDAGLVVKTVMIDCGRMLKRLRPAPQGRAHRVRKRSNHITIVVDSL